MLLNLARMSVYTPARAMVPLFVLSIQISRYVLEVARCLCKRMQIEFQRRNIEESNRKWRRLHRLEEIRNQKS